MKMILTQGSQFTHERIHSPKCFIGEDSITLFIDLW